MEELLILQQTEFQILAAALNFTRIYGVLSGEEISEQVFLYGLHEMVQKGILKEEESRFLVQEPYGTAIKAMKEAKTILAVTGYEKDANSVCFYIGDKIVSFQESSLEKQAVKIGLYEKEELFSLLNEYGFLPEALVDRDIAILQDKEEMLATFWETENPYFVRYQIFHKDNGIPEKPDKEFSLIVNPFNFWIEEKNEEGTFYEVYDKEGFFEKIRA